MDDTKEPTEAESSADQEALALRLRDAREFLGLSQELVAEKLSIPRPAISSIESGKRKVSSLELKQFAKLYNRSVDYLLGTQDAGGAEDPLVTALYRATRPLSEADREQVLRFATFLKGAGKPPVPGSGDKD